MNIVAISGRLTREPEMRNANTGTAIARWTLAVDRRYKRDGEQSADFISCVAFGKTAEHVEKWFHKGTKMELQGRIQTGSYEKDGQKVYTTDIVAENVEFAESKKAEGNAAPAQNTAPAGADWAPDDDFSDIDLD